MQTVEITHEFESDREDGQPFPGEYVVRLEMRRHDAESPWHVVSGEIESMAFKLWDSFGFVRLPVDCPVTLTPESWDVSAGEVIADYVTHCLWERYGEELSRAASNQWERDCNE